MFYGTFSLLYNSALVGIVERRSVVCDVFCRILTTNDYTRPMLLRGFGPPGEMDATVLRFISGAVLLLVTAQPGNNI